jgi:hypothetical protein
VELEPELFRGRGYLHCGAARVARGRRARGACAARERSRSPSVCMSSPSPSAAASIGKLELSKTGTHLNVVTAADLEGAEATSGNVDQSPVSVGAALAQVKLAVDAVDDAAYVQAPRPAQVDGHVAAPELTDDPWNVLPGSWNGGRGKQGYGSRRRKASSSSSSAATATPTKPLPLKKLARRSRSAMDVERDAVVATIAKRTSWHGMPTPPRPAGARRPRRAAARRHLRTSAPCPARTSSAKTGGSTWLRPRLSPCRSGAPICRKSRAISIRWISDPLAARFHSSSKRSSSSTSKRSAEFVRCDLVYPMGSSGPVLRSWLLHLYACGCEPVCACAHVRSRRRQRRRRRRQMIVALWLTLQREKRVRLPSHQIQQRQRSQA